MGFALLKSGGYKYEPELALLCISVVANESWLVLRWFWLMDDANWSLLVLLIHGGYK